MPKESYSGLLDEIERLKAGRFTPEEFQNLCHNFNEEDKEAFFKGCASYQNQLFGESAVDRAISNFRSFLVIEIDRLYVKLGPSGTTGFDERWARNEAIGEVISLVNNLDGDYETK